jgi:hypothetical protein
MKIHFLKCVTARYFREGERVGKGKEPRFRSTRVERKVSGHQFGTRGKDK